LVELLVALAMVGVLLGLLLPAIQRIRAAGYKARCAENLREIGLALHHYHDIQKSFPAGVTLQKGPDSYVFLSWLARILPYIEQESLWKKTQEAYALEKDFTRNPPHIALDSVVAGFVCPADDRIQTAQTSRGYRVAFTSYLGIMGLNLESEDGLLFADSRIRLADVLDGTSNTLLTGERPPSTDLFYGWWYAGHGQLKTGSCDMVMGVREWNSLHMMGCVEGPYSYRSGQLDNQCDQFHFWSLHPGGAHFLLADGAVRFLTYDADTVLPALATRAGGETAPVP
jgi:prepilin-type processing-associated H-X9-DG protein